MHSGTASAVPGDLIRYADRAKQMDQELVSLADNLEGALVSFEAACTEYRVSVRHLADELHNYGRGADDIDGWVRQVGVRFQVADVLRSDAAPRRLVLQLAHPRLFKVAYAAESSSTADTVEQRWWEKLKVKVKTAWLLLTGVPAWLRDMVNIILRRTSEAPTVETDQVSGPASPGNKIEITERINLRSTPGMGRTVIDVLSPGMTVEVVSAELITEDGHTWMHVRLDDGRSGWIAVDVLGILGRSEERTDSTKGQGASPSTKSFISQLSPSGDHDVLGKAIHYSYYDETKKETVHSTSTAEQDLIEWGCLMSCFTMLLQDKGLTVSLTDFYKANWQVEHPGRDWDTETKDGLTDLNTLVQGGTVKQASGGKYQQDTLNIRGEDDQSKHEWLNGKLKDGPVIVKVWRPAVTNEKDEVVAKEITQHWIVVDRALGGGRYEVRDPSSHQDRAEIQIGANGKYQFHPDRQAKVVRAI